jgi:putative effector of murein hydrolase LrgA (UPF0299 family)
MSKEKLNIGNISTIVKYISMLIACWFIGLLINHGINLPISTEGLSEVIGAIIFLILAHIDATNPNSIWNQKSSDDIEDEEDDI